MTVPTIPLNTGQRIPQLGLGTYKMLGDDAEHAVATALELGYRHIDTAQMYGNEAAVGRGIAKSGVPREEIFITTKLDNPNHESADARRSFAESLEKLGTDYVDLFLIHWPLPNQYDGDYLSTWKTLEEFAADGRARSIGVSNFQRHHLETIVEGSETVPAVDQIELHPYFQNQVIAEFCRENRIAVEAWAPLVRGMVADEPGVASVAKNHNCTAAQAVLAWHLAKGHIIFPKSVHRERLEENLAAAMIELTVDEVEQISSLDRGELGRTGMHPDTMERVKGSIGDK
ncbi:MULTISPECIES: aldo/keto reductase [unclassified Actinobaculum]|uniref:aldo/keto reductase n=1 Tax=unclassified Actinobaculum TaxID=2609299 RepID=UPI000D52A2E7|nr:MULTISPECIES: aldo/keto reductase [unclassified Actinobaculum]AWE43279.1 oxidoreductase [Actinobaculum sp. 313]RTE49827.1 aldo/keto reductase [Actinobaculum sp. 352]